MMGPTIDLLNFQLCSFNKQNCLLRSLLDRNGNGDGGADHGVVTHADQTHHLNETCKENSENICKSTAGLIRAPVIQSHYSKTVFCCQSRLLILESEN